VEDHGLRLRSWFEFQFVEIALHRPDELEQLGLIRVGARSVWVQLKREAFVVFVDPSLDLLELLSSLLER
jgi:hypothetical protein